MTQFRILIFGMAALILLFTITAIMHDGFDLITPFVQPILAMTWPGQFHLDFTFYLVLSGVWMAWRLKFSPSGIALGLLAPPLGMLFFAPYLIYLIGQSGGDARKLVLGQHA